jgi:hypothetical protein
MGRTPRQVQDRPGESRPRATCLTTAVRPGRQHRRTTKPVPHCRPVRRCNSRQGQGAWAAGLASRQQTGHGWLGWAQ